ncbi:phosphotransferase [candidate division KSB1 bacterium]|nr:phosphotransferase [candidate division KSB1 bacterium]
MDVDQLQQLLNAHGFKGTASFKRIPTGKFNETYRCLIDRMGRNEAVILRIAPPPITGFLFYERGMMAQEPGLHQLIRERTSLPVPAILVYDNSRTLINRDFLIMEHLTGTPLSESYVSPADQDKVYEQVGRYLKELHTHCTTTQYGYLGEHKCMKPASTWKDAFHVMWNKLVDDITKCNVYDFREADCARQALELHQPIFKRDVSASLLHMDIWGQNILIDNNSKITGILDWDRALWGDPEIEFAVLDYCGFNVPAFWRGYGEQHERNTEANIRMLFYHLYEIQKYLVIWTLRAGSLSRVQSYKQYSLRAIDKLLQIAAEMFS